MLFNLWYRSSIFLSKKNPRYDRIIYERYYCREFIIYFNTTDEEEECLENYIRNGFKYDAKFTDIFTNDMVLFLEDKRFIRNDKLTNLIDNSKIYFSNQSNTSSITPQELEDYIKD